MGDPLKLRATIPRIHDVARAAGLSETALQRALRIATATPSPAEWFRFLSVTLAILGALLLAAGAISFVAFNWDLLGRFAKFLLIGAAIVAATLVAWRKLPRITGQAALFVAAVLVGALLAVYGQTYQTGADPYGLFLTWFLLILPWVVLGRFGALWLLAIALLDTALVLYWSQVVARPGSAIEMVLPLLVAGVHGAAFIAWEWQSRRASPWMRERWAAQVVFATGVVALFIPAAAFVLEGRKSGVPGLVAVVALWTLFATVARFRVLGMDRFAIAVTGTAVLAWVAFVVARILFDVLDLETTGLLVMAAFVLFEISLGLKWFRGLPDTPPGSPAEAEA